MREKFFSARYILALTIGGVFCYGFIVGKVSSDAFIGLAVYIIKSYFDKVRKNEGGKNEKTTTVSNN